MLKRIKYVSRFTRPLSPEEVALLGEYAAKKNTELQVTGVLMAAGEVFFQVLEGPAASVDALFESICRDERHTDVLLLSAANDVPQRLFPDWAMKTVQLDSEATMRMEPIGEILHAIFEQRKLIETLTSAVDRAIWNEFRAQSQ